VTLLILGVLLAAYAAWIIVSINRFRRLNHPVRKSHP
jgi:hypothetical protein